MRPCSAAPDASVWAAFVVVVEDGVTGLPFVGGEVAPVPSETGRCSTAAEPMNAWEGTSP